MEKIGRKVIISGHVQGVGFRYFTFRQAQTLGLTGHAKNLANGNVEVLLFGESDNIDKMLKWLKNGPKTSSVSSANATEIPYIEKGYFSCL